MAEKPKAPQSARTTSDTPSSSPAQAAGGAGSRRVAARKLREERQQRLVLTITGIAIGLALLVVLGGLIYEQVWLPSRPVARVGDTTLTRQDYWAERRTAYAGQIVQNFQLLALFGGSPEFAQQFQGQSPAINRQVAQIRSAAVDEFVLGQWETRTIKQRGAANLGLTVSQDAINQAIAQELGPLFITTAADPNAPETPLAPETTADPAAPTATPLPTSTPIPTPGPADAPGQVDQVINEIFRLYEFELLATGDSPNLTREDFRTALNVQFGEQVLNREVQARLVPDDGFVASSEPERIEARQVLIAVDQPADATQEQRDAAFAAALPRAEQVAATLQAGADFAEVAAAESDDPGSAEQGGNLGSFDRGGNSFAGVTYPPELVEAAFTLEEGVISAPIRTIFGWHVIEVITRTIPSRDDQLRTVRTAALDGWLAEQRSAVSSERFPAVTPTPSAEPTVAVPTPIPTFQPGPPTAIPEPTPAPEPTAVP
ncbi:MAG: peptidylprolyl isomerase [Oscillochloridaceae bacterium umkhey_bin13]